jgi:hypothetical protein
MNFFKPHLSWKEVMAMSNDVAVKAGSIPDFLRKMSTGASFGNIDASDLKPPRLKLLAGQSPEVLQSVPGAKPGNFWVTILNANLGQEVVGSPILLRKTYQIWAPKGMNSASQGPLATASDGINWDVPNQTFEIRFPQNPKVYTWKIGHTVAETGAHRFGSSQDDDSSSKPIATLTYDVLWLIDLPGGRKQLVVFTSARTGTKPTQTFISTTKAMGIDQFYQRYKIFTVKKRGPTGDDYFTYDYQYMGSISDEEEAKTMRALYDQYAASGFISESMDHDDAPAPKAAPSDTARRDDEDSIPF